MARATARADELSPDEIVDGMAALRDKVLALEPQWLAVAGVTAFRTAFASRRAQVGPQPETVGRTRLWVLPNPSGLNAHYTPSALAEEFARLRERAG